MPVAAIGLGANAGDCSGTIAHAVEELAKLGSVRARSQLYRTKAWGVTTQPDFLNAAVLLETELGPRDLLAALQRIERQLGRTATYRWGPRIIDLDILTYGDLAVDDPELIIPHPHLFERAFALAPLAEIDPTARPAYARLTAQARSEVEVVPERS